MSNPNKPRSPGLSRGSVTIPGRLDQETTQEIAKGNLPNTLKKEDYFKEYQSSYTLIEYLAAQGRISHVPKKILTRNTLLQNPEPSKRKTILHICARSRTLHNLPKKFQTRKFLEKNLLPDIIESLHGFSQNNPEPLTVLILLPKELLTGKTLFTKLPHSEKLVIENILERGNQEQVKDLFSTLPKKTRLAIKNHALKLFPRGSPKAQTIKRFLPKENPQNEIQIDI